jgi:triacylglycerol lipase
MNLVADQAKTVGNGSASQPYRTVGAESQPYLWLGRRCVRACADAYRSATIESAFAHLLVVRSGECGVRNAEEGFDILAFRGSGCIQDWLTDARCSFICPQILQDIEHGQVRVHRGFWLSMDSLFDQVLRLDQRSCPRPVVVTGHSKGAAEALLCAYLLAKLGRPVAGVVTFGGPRVGNAAWRRAYNAQAANNAFAKLGDITWRFVNQEDLVPRVPTWLSGYRHVGREVFLPSIGGICLRPALWFKVVSDLAGAMTDLHLLRVSAVADHPIARYVEAVSKG